MVDTINLFSFNISLYNNMLMWAIAYLVIVNFGQYWVCWCVLWGDSTAVLFSRTVIMKRNPVSATAKKYYFILLPPCGIIQIQKEISSEWVYMFLEHQRTLTLNSSSFLLEKWQKNSDSVTDICAYLGMCGLLLSQGLPLNMCLIFLNLCATVFSILFFLFVCVCLCMQLCFYCLCVCMWAGMWLVWVKVLSDSEVPARCLSHWAYILKQILPLNLNETLLSR